MADDGVARVCLDMLRTRTSRREDSLDNVPDPIRAIGRRGRPEADAMLADSVVWRGSSSSRNWTAECARSVKEVDPDVVEEWKWVKPTKAGTPVRSHGGIICAGESYKNVVKLTFAKGASLKDPARRFNSSLDGNVRRAIDIHEGENVDESAFKALVRQAFALNWSGKKSSKKANS